ncbi:MAG: hypothetical protein QX199_11220 [Methylococcaceae bacterium]
MHVPYFPPRSSMLYNAMPASIDATNSQALGGPAAALTTAGPGQNPESLKY